MKNLFKLFGIIAIVAVIGFSMAACGDDDGGGGENNNNNNPGGGNNVNVVGTWEGDGYIFQFSEDYTFIYDKGAGFDAGNSGTYTVSGNTITMKQNGTTYRTGTINGNTMTTTASGYGDWANATLHKQP